MLKGKKNSLTTILQLINTDSILNNKLNSCFHFDRHEKGPAYLEAGVETKAVVIKGVRDAPFINDDHPGT